MLPSITSLDDLELRLLLWAVTLNTHKPSLTQLVLCIYHCLTGSGEKDF